MCIIPKLGVTSALAASLTEAPNPETITYLDDDGLVKLNDIMIVKIACEQDFSNFPFDDMKCNFIVGPSHDIADRKIHVEWNILDIKNSKSITLGTHKLVRSEVFKVPFGNRGKMMVNSGKLTLQRYSLFYFFQAYIPNSLTVMIAWLSFSISPSAVPARVTMGISSLIAMVLQYGNLIMSIPKVGYVKGIDIWMIGCVLFIFISMGEFAYICYLQSASIGSSDIPMKYKVSRIDGNARILYLVLFAVFVVLYFVCTIALS